MQTKKLASKKKVENNLASLVKKVAPKDEKPVLKLNLEQIKTNLKEPVRSFKMPYKISSIAFSNFEESCELLALGLKDGAIVVLDLILGFEKYFLEKHPMEVTSLAFF